MNSSILLYNEASNNAINSSNNIDVLSNLNLGEIIPKLLQKLSTFFNIGDINKLQNIKFDSISTIVYSIGIGFIVVFLICIMLYLLKSIGLYTIARNKKENLAWLSFIPYADLYVLGLCINETKLFGIKIFNAKYALPILLIVNKFKLFCPLTTFLFILTLYGILYRLYQEKAPNSAVVLILLSIIFFPLIPIFIFAIRNVGTIADKKYEHEKNNKYKNTKI